MLLACLLVAAIHVVMVWGLVSEFWGDTGRWLHEIERFAQGERLYVDYTWPFPPLAMWLIGSGAKVVGTGIHQVWALTTVVYLAVVIAFVRYASAVAPRDLMAIVSVTGLVGALAYAQVGSAPLPLGMYSPAAPLGGLFLLGSVGSLVARVRGDDSWVVAAVLGTSASLAVLTKQDFWAPALATVVLGLWMGPTRHRVLVAATAVVPASLGYGFVLVQLGGSDFLAMLGGFGHAAEFGDLGFPSGRRLAAGAGATSLALWLGLFLARPRDARWWVAAAALSGVAVLGYLLALGPGGLRLLEEDVLRRGFSLFLPFVVLGWTWSHRHTAPPLSVRLAQALLLVSIAARARRGFQGLEWYHVMLELPTYALVVRACLGAHRVRAQQVAFAVLLPVACYLYWHFGRGALTEQGQLVVERVETARGAIYLRPNAAGDYRFVRTTIDRLDPSGQRPLFAFGYAGGWNYFMGRRNPTPAPHGFHLARLAPDSILSLAAAARPIVLDVRLFAVGTIADPGAGVFEWDAPRVLSHFARVDRLYFERLIAGCPAVARHPDRDNPFVVVHDCGR